MEKSDWQKLKPFQYCFIFLFQENFTCIFGRGSLGGCAGIYPTHPIGPNSQPDQSTHSPNLLAPFA
jgi:hypothetical protein